jgi:hypothetical protein
MSTESAFHITGGIHFDNGYVQNTPAFFVGEVKQGLISEGEMVSQMGNDWVLADGRDVTGSTYHAITGATSVPDMRGQFLRGLDTNGSVDPGGASRSVGDAQVDAFQGHWHISSSSSGTPGAPYNVPQAGTNPSSGETYFSRDAVSDGTHGSPRISSETRPKNITVNFFIKIN